MPAKDLIIDLQEIDTSRVVADIADIRRVNSQRFEMEQLSAIVFLDVERKICVGYKDVTADEFWVRGHMPGRPLMPGVLMLEAAAQLCSYFAYRFEGLAGKNVIVGFGGLDEVKFREPVFPGDRLYLLCRMDRMRPGKVFVCSFQGVVRGEIAVEGTLKGVAIPTEAIDPQTQATS